MVKASFARLGTFAKGVAYGLKVAGWKPGNVAPKICKTDGTAPTRKILISRSAPVRRRMSALLCRKGAQRL